MRKYKLGMYFALRFYLAMKQEQGPDTAAGRQPTRSKPSSSGGLAPRQSVGGFARSEGIGAQPQQLEQWMLSLVLGHASATLSDVAASAPAAAAREGSANGSSVVAVTASLPRAVTEAAEACVCACLLLSRTDVLFGRVFQLFAQQGVVPGALGALVETVELAVLSDLLQGLAPEVMQVGADTDYYYWLSLLQLYERVWCWLWCCRRKHRLLGSVLAVVWQAQVPETWQPLLLAMSFLLQTE